MRDALARSLILSAIYTLSAYSRRNFAPGSRSFHNSGVDAHNSPGMSWQEDILHYLNLLFVALASTVTAGGRACDYPAAFITTVDGEGDSSMVAKDYPFYLVVKRMNCSLEVQTVSSNTQPAKEVEVGSLICDITIIDCIQLLQFVYGENVLSRNHVLAH